MTIAIPTDAGVVPALLLGATMTDREAIAAFLEHRRLRVMPRSLKRYELELRRWFKWRRAEGYSEQIEAVTLNELTRFFLFLLDDGLAPATREGTWRYLKSLWRFLDRRGHLAPGQGNFFSRDDGIPRPRIPDVIQPTYEVETIVQMLAAVPEPDRPDAERETRNRAIILLLWESGMRAAELCSLEDGRVDLDERSAVIKGKGDKERWVFWHDSAAAVLDAYLKCRRGPSGGPLLRDLADGGPLTPNAARLVLKRLAKRAGVELPERGPLHAFRRRFADDVLEAGIDGLDLQQLMGHASIVSTMTYVRKSPARLKRIHRRIRRNKPD